MELYTLKNIKTGEEKNFIKKNRLAKTIGINTDRIELAVAKNQPIRKRNGEAYTVEYRNIDLGVKIEDEKY